jgi:thiamine pyrophosphate-dependent acetolactate synthase large subunit-like protein
MQLRTYLEPLQHQRGPHQVVVPTMGAAREWMRLGSHPLDFVYAPSAMGQAPSLGLGLALARPDRQVIVLNGDGCQLMNLGCLATISALSVANLVLIIIDNGVFEVTGGQLTTASPRGRANTQPVDFALLAQGAGWNSVFQFRSPQEWAVQIDAVLSAAGPTCVVWKVEPDPAGTVPKSPAPPGLRSREFRQRFRDC